jgi:hypothetical protein
MTNSDAGLRQIGAIFEINGGQCSPEMLLCFGLQQLWSPKHESFPGEQRLPFISKRAWIFCRPASLLFIK